MDPQGFPFDTPPAPPDAAAERRQSDAREAMRAAPTEGAAKDTRSDEDNEEPGYGHGV